MLSESQQKIIQESWALVSNDLKKSGADVFLRFFTEYPEHQKAFRPFANVPFDQLAGNKRFQAHAFTVMSTINGMVDNVDDPELLEEMLLKTGANHGRRHKISPSAFNEFKQSFKGYLETALSKCWDEETESAWEIVVDVIIGKIIEGMDVDD